MHQLDWKKHTERERKSERLLQQLLQQPVKWPQIFTNKDLTPIQIKTLVWIFGNFENVSFFRGTVI